MPNLCDWLGFGTLLDYKCNSNQHASVAYLTGITGEKKMSHRTMDRTFPTWTFQFHSIRIERHLFCVRMITNRADMDDNFECSIAAEHRCTLGSGNVLLICRVACGKIDKILRVEMAKKRVVKNGIKMWLIVCNLSTVVVAVWFPICIANIGSPPIFFIFFLGDNWIDLINFLTDFKFNYTYKNEKHEGKQYLILSAQ